MPIESFSKDSAWFYIREFAWLHQKELGVPILFDHVVNGSLWLMYRAYTMGSKHTCTARIYPLMIRNYAEMPSRAHGPS
jgi:hypothetical protein